MGSEDNKPINSTHLQKLFLELGNHVLQSYIPVPIYNGEHQHHTHPHLKTKFQKLQEVKIEYKYYMFCNNLWQKITISNSS